MIATELEDTPLLVRITGAFLWKSILSSPQNCPNTYRNSYKSMLRSQSQNTSNTILLNGTNLKHQDKPDSQDDLNISQLILFNAKMKSSTVFLEI